MTTRKSFARKGRFKAPRSVGDQYAAVRSAVQAMDASEVARQLPNLVETIVAESTDSEDTVKFLIGISFSKNETLLDYRLERLVYPEDADRPYLEAVKPAVTQEHIYVTFPYPPDPQFDAATLRGALLVALEKEFTRGATTSHQPDPDDEDDRDGLTRRISDFWRQIRPRL